MIPGHRSRHRMIPRMRERRRQMPRMQRLGAETKVEVEKEEATSGKEKVDVIESEAEEWEEEDDSGVGRRKMLRYEGRLRRQQHRMRTRRRW